MNKNKVCIEVGQRLKQGRKALNIPLHKAVQELGLKSWRDLLKIENGSIPASEKTLDKMSKLYNISIDFIFTGEEE
jgi:transcriptional regulator with XRE-family HTH domain